MQGSILASLPNHFLVRLSYYETEVQTIFCIKHPKIKNALALTLLDLRYHNHLRLFDDCLQKARQQICYQPCIHSKWYKNRQNRQKKCRHHTSMCSCWKQNMFHLDRFFPLGHLDVLYGCFQKYYICCMGMTSDLGQVYALYCHYHITMLLPAAARL